VRTEYRKFVTEWKDLEKDFYSNDSLNNDLENEFKKDSCRWSNQTS
jgi:hypothetical protein